MMIDEARMTKLLIPRRIRARRPVKMLPLVSMVAVWLRCPAVLALCADGRERVEAVVRGVVPEGEEEWEDEVAENESMALVPG